MKRLLTVLLLLFTLVFALTSCDDDTIHTKEEITAAMNAEKDKDGKYAVNYLDDWKLPGLNTSTKNKFRGVEVLYRDYYIKDLPDAYTMAKSTAELFLEYFYDDVDLKDSAAVTDGLIACYVEAVGDPYSFYRVAEAYDEYETDMSGEFAGIGVTVQYDALKETMTVTSVNIGGGAADAGIAVNDIIIKVNGKSVTELGYQKAISEIRGIEGTRVRISVSREGQELEFDIERKHVVEETVTYSLDASNIGYIRITDFKEITFSQFKTAIDYMEEKGAVGIVYDLRGNPGGYLDTVVNMLSYIAPKGTEIVSVVHANGYKETTKCNDAHTLSLPSVVICDGNTASAGELFTAAIRDFGTGENKLFDSVIVGTKTYGKGVMQTTQPFTDGSALTFTIAYYNPPCDINYDGVGITPNRTVAYDQNSETDNQLAAAMEEMAKLLLQKVG